MKMEMWLAWSHKVRNHQIVACWRGHLKIIYDLLKYEYQIHASCTLLSSVRRFLYYSGPSSHWYRLQFLLFHTAQHRFPIGFVSFFVSSVCLLVRVTMVDKNKAVVCCLLATSPIMLSENKKSKRKMWSKKWYLKRYISCDAHLLNELLKTGVPWDDANVVSAGKLKKMWDSLSELRSSVCERLLEKTVLRSALFPVKTTQFTQFFLQVWRHTVKYLRWTESLW
jgi:hypothetical protein